MNVKKLKTHWNDLQLKICHFSLSQIRNNMILELSLKNCFGIGEFYGSFDMSEDNVIMIYAPNGTMKTSLARTFLCLENNHNAADLIDDTKVSSYSFMLDGVSLTHDQIYVYKTEDNQIEPNGIYHLEEDNILSFNSSPNEVRQFYDLLEPIDNLLNQIDQEFNKLIKNKTRVFYDEALKVFKVDDILCKYDSVNEAIFHANNYCASDCSFDNFYYDEIFDVHEVSEKYIRKYHEALVDINKRNKVRVVSKTRWKRLCEIVDTNKYVNERIGNLEVLRRDLILAFVSDKKELFFKFSVLYNDKRKKLVDIINRVKEDSHLWNQVICTFNNRFHVPYELKLENKAETILNKETPYLKYTHIGPKGRKEYKSKDHFLNFVSTGEKRAYYLLINLFEIEKRKRRKDKQVIVIDDIAESFDYRNKYAIVEYLAELKDCKNMILIILTHNFDFYRTIHSRLDVSNIFIADRDIKGNISLQKGKYVRDIIKNVLIKNIDSPKCLIALIPFVRNIVEYTKGVETKDYSELTDYLHAKYRTSSLKMSDLMQIISTNIFINHTNVYKKSNQKYLDSLFVEAESVYVGADNIAIENKLLLSIAIRIKAELFVISKLPPTLVNLEKCGNQSSYLFKKYKETFPMKVHENVILRKVLMLTSENIHINNFMFEPIIDISLEELKSLYRETKRLK